MPSQFGKRKPSVQQRAQPQALGWRNRIQPSGVDSLAAEKALEALYRITHTTPSKLTRARLMRAQRHAAI